MKYTILTMAVVAASLAANAAQDTTVEDIALTIWTEARGESFESRRFVASVIWNRAKGDTTQLSAVCRAPKQFSAWNKGRPVAIRRNAKDEAIWRECIAFGKAMARGEFEPCTDATHFCTNNPKWSKTTNLVKKIGKMKFYV